MYTVLRQKNSHVSLRKKPAKRSFPFGLSSFFLCLSSFFLCISLFFLSACSDDTVPERPDVEVPSYISVNVSAQRTTTGGTPSGGEDGDGREDGEDRENQISEITILIYPKPADGLGINTPAAEQITVRAFCWKVNKVVNGEDETDARSENEDVKYTTGTHLLPDSLAFGAYELLVVANEDLTQELDNRSLAVVRNYVVNREPFDRNDASQSGVEYDPSKYTNFVLSSQQPVDIVVGNGAGHHGSGTREDPYVPTTNPVPLERLAARIDFVPDADNTHWNAADSTYDYPVYDAADNVVATFKLEYCCPFNLVQQQYLFKHTTTLKDTTTINYCGRETYEEINGLRFATNYVIDPQTYSSSTEELVGDYFYPDLYHRTLTENIVALKARFPVKPSGQLKGPDNNGRRYYILGYSAENTHTFEKLHDNAVPYSSYIAGIRIYGRYVRKGQTVDDATYVPFDWYIRHSAPDGRADISRPLTFALVRNNIYRIYISKIHAIDGDFHVEFKVNVVPWQRYEHAEIPL